MGRGEFRLCACALAAVLVPAGLFAQERRITGRVTRADLNLPVIAAEVSVLGQHRSQPALSDSDGRYGISAPAGEVRLQVRFIGFTRVEVVVPAEQNAMDISMQPDVFRLDELVVTGQATSIERRSATTAIAYVSGEDVSKVSSPTILNALNGKLTGVNLQSNSGAPGGGIQMQIRGNNTILAAFDPLFVVDGVIYSNASIPSGRGFTTNAAAPFLETDPVNRTADLNPADIASIEVLKGAAASSIYGSKAANGVVVITTVRGRAGPPRINVAQRVGVFSPLRLLDARHWTADSAIAYWGEPARAFFDGDDVPYFDHYAQVFGNRKLSHETLADVRGGSRETGYFLSGNVKRDEGIERGTGASRQSLRVNLDQTLRPGTDIRVTSVFTRNENDRGWNNNCNNFGCHGYALAYIPSFVDLRRKNPDATYPTPTIGPQSNPVQLTEIGVNHEETNRFTGGLTLGWNALRAERQTLRIVAAAGIDGFDQRNEVWTPNDLFFERPQALPGEAVESSGRSVFYNWNVNGIHIWTASRWAATTSFGLQYEGRRLHTLFVRAQNLLPGQRNVNQGTNPVTFESLQPERTLALYAQEGVLLMQDRLLLVAGLRAERSSVNGDIDRYHVFPKVSGSYRFIDLFGSVSDVKLRAAYGETGNQPLFGQKFTTLATPGLGGQRGVTVSTVSGFARVEPERLKEVEAGIDGEALNRRLTWELTGFTRNTTNLLLLRVPSPSSGFASQTFNGGKIRNSGIEAALGFTPVLTATTQWITRDTFTRYTSEVVDLAGLPAFSPPGSGFGTNGTRVELGKPITQIVGFDLNADGTRASTLSQLGNSAPDFRVGFLNDFSYKAVTLSTVLDWQQGGDVINSTQRLYDDGRNSKDWGTETWKARYQGYLSGSIRPYIEDATFLKVREVSLGVDVPTRIFGPLIKSANSLHVSLTGRNLFMWTRYRGLDPEVANFGPQAVRNNLDISPYPPSRGLFFNIGVGF